MTKYCLKNPNHKLLGADKCLVPGCGGRLGDTAVEAEAEKKFEDGEKAYTLNRDREAADRALVEAETARADVEGTARKAANAEAKLSDDVERLQNAKLEMKSADEPDGSGAGSRETTSGRQPETLIERVEDGVETMVEGEVAKVRAAIADMLERAKGKEVEARRSADAAAQHAKTATDAAVQAAANAKPHASQPGFDEAARHAAGADFHANASQAAADEAASHAAAASNARQTVEGLATDADGQKTASGLQALVAEIEKAVALVADFAARAAAALARAKAASGEATAMGGFFVEALSLWRSLRGE